MPKVTQLLTVSHAHTLEVLTVRPLHLNVPGAGTQKDPGGKEQAWPVSP